MINTQLTTLTQKCESDTKRLDIYSSLLGSSNMELATKLITVTENICKDYQSFGLTKDDLLAGAYQGLVLACQNYDTNANNFSTFASHWIHISILSELLNYNISAVPPFLIEQYKTIKNRLAVFQINYSTSCNIHTINTLLTNNRRDYHANKNELDIVEYTNEKVFEALDTTQHTAFETLCYKDLQEICLLYKQLLPLNERQVIDMTFGFGSYTPLTTGKIAKKMNLSRSRVNQIYNKALSKILNAIRCDVSQALYFGVSRLNINLLDQKSKDILKAFAGKEVYWRGLDGLSDSDFTGEDVLNTLNLLI